MLRCPTGCDDLMTFECRRNFFSLFLESKNYASYTCISSSKSAAAGPNRLKFGEDAVSTFADNSCLLILMIIH